MSDDGVVMRSRAIEIASIIAVARASQGPPAPPRLSPEAEELQKRFPYPVVRDMRGVAPAGSDSLGQTFHRAVRVFVLVLGDSGARERVHARKIIPLVRGPILAASQLGCFGYGLCHLAGSK